MKVFRVETTTDMQDFVSLPKTLYADYPNWVPPLWHEEKHAYDGKHNVMLRDNDHQLFILKDDANRTIGRIIAYIDSSFNEHWHCRTGLFGAYECVDDPEASRLLLQTAADWLSERKIDRIRGPIHPIAESWGFLLEGFDSLPVLMAPYNPPYYLQQMEDFGLEKVKDLYAYEADCSKGYEIPERINRFAKTFMARHPDIMLRPIRKKDLLRDAEYIWNITNIALKDNWGYTPVDRPVMDDMIERLKLILDTDAVWFVEEYGRPIGFALGFPDPNPLVKEIGGNILPTGFLKFILKRNRIRRYRLLSLAILPEYHGLGLDVLLYKAIYDALSPKGILLEANYILEDNWSIRNALEKLELEKTKSYRIYEMGL